MHAGLFVISDVKTCGNSTGYCLLGNDCTTDDDFLPDPTGNCDGLKGAFTPSASFACCKFNRRSSLSSSPLPPPPKRFGKPPTSTTVATVDAAAGTPKKATVPRNARERVDGQTDDDQLAKLDQIGLVVRKIIEQLLNETANVIRPADEQRVVVVAPAATAGTATTVGSAATVAAVTTVEPAAVTTVEPAAAKPVDGDSARTEAPETDEGMVNQTGTDTPGTDGEAAVGGGPEADAVAVDDDELRADKRVCRKSCNAADIVFAVDKKSLCYGTLLDENWILTSAACATRYLT